MEGQDAKYVDNYVDTGKCKKCTLGELVPVMLTSLARASEGRSFCNRGRSYNPSRMTYREKQSTLVK
jgi:hypothetical protein